MNERIYYSHEAELQAQRQRAMIALLFAGLGLAIGTVVAIMFAPKSGDQVRRDLASSIGDGAEASAETLKRLEREFADLRKHVEDRIKA